jgi:hypothetical protein
MKPKNILEQWVALESGDGLQQVQRVSRNLSIAALAICMCMSMAAVWTWPPALAFVFGGAVVGWLVGERNRLDSRKTVWPTVRGYLDWPRIHRDLAESRRHT